MNNKNMILKLSVGVAGYRELTNEVIKNSSAVKDELRKLRAE